MYVCVYVSVCVCLYMCKLNVYLNSAISVDTTNNN